MNVSTSRTARELDCGPSRSARTASSGMGRAQPGHATAAPPLVVNDQIRRIHHGADLGGSTVIDPLGCAAATASAPIRGPLLGRAEDPGHRADGFDRVSRPTLVSPLSMRASAPSEDRIRDVGRFGAVARRCRSSSPASEWRRSRLRGAARSPPALLHDGYSLQRQFHAEVAAGHTTPATPPTLGIAARASTLQDKQHASSSMIFADPVDVRRRRTNDRAIMSTPWRSAHRRSSTSLSDRRNVTSVPGKLMPLLSEHARPLDARVDHARPRRPRLVVDEDGVA